MAKGRNESGKFAKGNDLGNQFPPGQSGNPAGRPPAAGRSIAEHMNDMQDFTVQQLREVLKNEEAPATKRAAAIQWLAALQPTPDIADFEPYLTGDVRKLEQLKKMKVDTTQVKKAKVTLNDKTGDRVVELEMRDHGGKDLDRIMDRTSGRPRQITETQHTMARSAEQLLEDARAVLGGGREPEDEEAEPEPAPDPKPKPRGKGA